MNKIYNIIIILIFFLAITISPALSKSDKPIVSQVKAYHLPNGQTLIIKEVHTNPIVTIDTWVRTGSINENDENNGVAHFLEHLFFKGTKNHPTGEIDQILESKGAIFNAATSKDYTHYYITISSKFFKEALELHSDMLLNPAIPPEEMEKERKVVIEEIRRAEDDPDRQVYYGLNNLIFKNHPYKYDTLGYVSIIENIPREKIFEFYNKWYVPSNMVTIIVGDVDTEEVIELVKEYFGKNEAETMTLPEYAPEPVLTESLEIIQKGDYKQAYMEMGFNAPSMKEAPKTYALDVAAIILGQGRSSRLNKRLKLDENLVNNLFVSNFPMKDEGIFIFDYNLQPEHIDRVKQITFEEIEKIKKEPVTAEELSKAKNQVARDFIYGNESVAGTARSIGYNVLVAKLEEYTQYVEKINSVTAEDIMEATTKYLNTNAMATSILLPEKEEAKQITDKTLNDNVEPNTKPETEEGKKESGTIKTILPNGMTLLYKFNPANDVVSVNVYVKGGKLLQDKAGLASLTTNLLLKGTESRSAEDIANETENLGIAIDVDANDDYIKIDTKSTKNDFTESFMVLTDILNNAKFEQKEIDNVKKSMINAIKATEDTPLSYAFIKTYEKAYGGHPYGHVGDMVLEDLPNITREEVIDYYKKYFVPNNMIISVVGNVPEELVKRYIEQEWPSETKTEEIVIESSVKPIEETSIIKVPKDTKAAWLTMAWIAPELTDEGYLAMKLINTLLSGGLSARLTKNIREKKGLAYNLGSFFPSRKDKSLFVMYIGTEPKNINAVLKDFEKEIKDLKTTLVSEEELNDAKQRLTGNFALMHETNGQQAFYLGLYEAAGLSYEYDNEYPDLINEVTPEEIKAVANKIFDQPYILSIVAPEEDLKQLEE